MQLICVVLNTYKEILHDVVCIERRFFSQGNSLRCSSSSGKQEPYHQYIPKVPRYPRPGISNIAHFLGLGRSNPSIWQEGSVQYKHATPWTRTEIEKSLLSKFRTCVMLLLLLWVCETYSIDPMLPGFLHGLSYAHSQTCNDT